MFDLILKSGWVIDGSGGPPFRADVAIIDTMIADVGQLDGAEAARVIDVEGRYVVPGFHRRPRPRRPHAPGRPDSSSGLAPGSDDLSDRPGRKLVRAGLARHARLHEARTPPASTATPPAFPTTGRRSTNTLPVSTGAWRSTWPT